MDDPHKQSSQSSEIKNVLPDVVHSQQIPALGGVASVEAESAEIATNHSEPNENSDVQETSETESISEHIPSKVEDSTECDDANLAQEPQNLLKVETEQEKMSKTNSLNIPFTYSSISENPSSHDPSKQSASWPIDVNAVSDVHHISEESPVNLAISSDLSKEGGTQENKSNSALTPHGAHASNQVSSDGSPRSDKYVDSLNEETIQKTLESEDDKSLGQLSSSLKDESLDRVSSGSEEIIKLDIRGQGVPKYSLPTAKIIFGPPPEGSTILDQNMEPLPVFQNLLSPFLVGAGDGLKVEEVFDFSEQQQQISPDKSLVISHEKSIENSLDKSLDLSLDKESFSSEKSEQKDLLVEELTVDDVKEKDEDINEINEPSMTAQPKSIPPEETMSFSTMTTDYKTICEEYHAKLVHFEDAITQRDELIEELTISLQRSVRERDDLKHENEHLTNEVHQLQHAVGERSSSDHDTIKAQLSDFVKYQSMVNDSTKFYSALMSGGSSIQSSNGEKDMDHEEITVNYSKSDLRSSGSSEAFETGFESKLTTIINKFDEYIEENLRNKLRESIIQVLCDEIGKLRIESDTEVRELEAQLAQEKQGFAGETRRLRELLASVKAGNADIDALRLELSVKHEKEMENLRTYFEKKCSDMERSYSEEVWRGRACASPGGSASSLDAPDAAGDHVRRRTRSAELPSLTLESTPLEQAVKQTCRKYEQQIEELKSEHLAYINDLQARHKETIASLEEQITQLKAHIQTSENTEANVSLYQQDIDLELEKKAQLERRIEEVRQEVVHELQEQIMVLLSDPDAEVSSWPVELVALRDKIHGDAARLQQEKELSSLRDELSGGEDKWRQRRNLSFDQNRHLEEVTKERDGLKRVAVSLHRVVGQLVAYCASAEDELNRTVLAHLLARVLPADTDETFAEEESRPSTPNLSTDLNTSIVSKHVHFAPDLNSILSDLDEESIVGFLQQQRDLSADIKRELESSLKRLRQEAHELLDLSAKLSNKGRNESKMLESSQVKITELVQDLDTNQESCNNCELHRKNMEEAMAECLQRENLLRSDLEAAMIKIAQLMTSGERMHSTDLIAEGYGTGQQLQAALSSGLRGSPRARAQDGGTPASVSLDGCASPRAHLQRMAHDLDLMQRERDDLEQQLEAANRQLRSTRQFVEEQATEREAERDEFARRLQDLRDENARLATRLQNNARILNEVEQLEAQTREMNQIINELETRKAASDDELKATEEKIVLLRDIIANLEGQLEQKSAHETEILEQLETMKKTIDERDGKMRSLLGELESLRSERVEQSDVMCVKCGNDEDKYNELMEKVKEQCRWVEERIHRRTARLERVHEVCSAPCSEPIEDVSLRDQRDRHEVKTPDSPPTPRNEHIAELLGVWESLQAHARAEDAALKRIQDLEMQRNQLKDVAQEVRAERDVLQARMSEQALKISSLSARLQQHRNDAEALAHHASSQLSVQLHDALAEVQKLKEDLESKDKQLQRLKQSLEEKDKLNEQHQSLYGNSCNPKDKVVILERELSSAQSRIAQLEALSRGLEADKDEMHAALRDLQRTLAEKDEQLQEMLALKLEDENVRERSDAADGGKTSARTLSDIVSISEFDEQDLQMRRALDLRALNMSLPHGTEACDRGLNRTLPPEPQRHTLSSLNIEYIDADGTHDTPRADSLPAHLTSTQNKEQRFKRNVNETTMFGVDKYGECVKHSIHIPDNCSMFPNRDAGDSKDLTVDPKRINFSIEPSHDNRTQDEFTSLRELGISLDIRQENFPDILTQLKHEIKKSRSELENCKSELKNAEEQLCEFPALKEEVEELKGLLENTMATMETDKKFYENQLDNFSSNKKLLEQRLAELTQEVNEKSKDLHLLKEDILRRENMILELAKEKRNLTNKMAELEVKIDELQSRNNTLEKCEDENHQMREKMLELQKLEQLVSEKNHQIDSLNQHLDRLDDLQRCLSDKTEELENLKEAFEEKSNEIFQMQDTIDTLNRDIAKLTEDNNQLNDSNKELKLKLSKLEKEQENASLKLQNSETELERVNSLNGELTSKIDELKQLTDKLKDKETEIEILNEDINLYHEEIASLKEQLKMVSRSPSPRSKGEERRPERQADDKKQLVKIRKQISLLQHELDFNKKELNDKAYELAKAKLDVTELKNSAGQAARQAAEREAAAADLRLQLQRLAAERDQLAQQLETVSARIREESNVSELKAKLREKTERCQELEMELQDLKDHVDRLRSVEAAEAAGASARALVSRSARSRSPTAELERALRDQLDYSHTLDEDIMEQILSASSDDREEIPRLALNTSKSSSSIQSSSSERLNRLRVENDKLQMQVNNLELRLKDKDALIAELNRVRDKVSSEWQTAQLRYEAERDNAARLQLLLATHKECAETLQNQDSNMIQILKKRLESAMQAEVDTQQQLQQQRARVAHLERQLLSDGEDPLLQHEVETSERLRGEISVLRSKLELERSRAADAQAALDHAAARARKELEAARDACTALKNELADVKRLKHEASVELLRAKELLGIQSDTISELEKKLLASTKQKHVADALTEIETHKTELSREIATLKKCLAESRAPAADLSALRADRDQLAARLQLLQRQQQQQQQQQQQLPDDRDQAVRYLHGRCLRLESCRKALVWQKRYLQRVVLGYTELERSLRLTSARPARSHGIKRFKCAALAVVVTLRMAFLVRRRAQARAVSAHCLLRRDHDTTLNTPTATTHNASNSPPSRERPAERGGERPAHSVPRRALRHDLRLNLPASPSLDDIVRRSPYNVNSPQHNDPFILSSPRGEVATAYLNKLELVSRCLSHAMDASRDAP